MSLTLSAGLQAALAATLPAPAATPVCLLGAALSGPVGCLQSFNTPTEALEVFTDWATDSIDVENGDTALTDTLRFEPRAGLTVTRLSNGIPVAAYIPGLTADGINLSLLSPAGNPLPFGQQNQTVQITYQAPLSPLLVADQLRNLPAVPVTVLRVNGEHAYLTLANSEGDGELTLYALDAGEEGNNFLASLYLTGSAATPAGVLEVSGTQAGQPFSLLISLGVREGGVFQGVSTLSQLAMQINARAAWGSSPIIAWALEDGPNMLVEISEVPFANGDDSLDETGVMYGEEWRAAILDVLDPDATGVPMDLSSYSFVHVPVLPDNMPS